MNRTPRLLTTSQGLLAVELAILTVAGVFTGFWFEANPERAYLSVKSMIEQPVPGFMLGLQHWGGQLLFLHAFLHVAGLLFCGSFNADWTPRWHLSVATLILAFIYCATGNFLLFDRHGVQSAVIETSIVDRIPFFGSIFADWVRGGPKVEANTLRVWHRIHQWAPPLLLLGYGAIAVFYRRYDDEAKPYYGLVAALGLTPILVAASLDVPMGEGAKAPDFSSHQATVNWYAWPMHGALRALDGLHAGLGWLGALVLPLAFVSFLFAIPRLCIKVTQVFSQAVFILVCALFLLAGALFGGLPANPFDRGIPAATDEQGGPVSLSEADRQLADLGRRLFLSNQCSACHSLDGSSGGAGPDLGGIPANPKTLEWYMAWIKNPAKLRPGTTMPAYPSLTDNQLRALAAFLVSDKK